MIFIQNVKQDLLVLARVVLLYGISFCFWMICSICFLLAMIVTIDFVKRRMNAKSTIKRKSSALYAGRVWHKRYLPTPHSFNYPIFFAFVDLDECLDAFPWYWWPLMSCRFPALSKFDESDHLKDMPKNKNEQLVKRVRDLVALRTGVRPLGPIRLLTHLKYLGYCFNPVSFYYCFDESDLSVQAIVGEVSNTPWIEMHSYVLSDNVENVEVLSPPKEIPRESFRFRFKKEFHVSPFMDMDFNYDWTFSQPNDRLSVRTSMLKSADLWFQATLKLSRHEFSAFNLLWYMIVFPAYTVILQILIHWQALLLWKKNVPFYPHPTAKETGASKLIAAIMKPLFALQEKIQNRKSTTKRN